MKDKRFTQSIILACIVISLMTPIVSAQTTLYPNETLKDEQIWGRENSFYESNLYQVFLITGKWTIVVQSFFDLEVNITVATDSSMTNIIAESGAGRGNYPQVDFDLTSNETVYILIHENSIYGDSSGFYNIGVYDDAHLTSLTTIGGPSLGTDPFTAIISPVFIFIGIAGIFIFIIVLVGCFRIRTQSQSSAIQIIQAPQSAIPKKYRSKSGIDDGLRMVRIPEKCPQCSAPLSHESIDWVGPLEAKCNYCGSTVRAKFEKI